MGTTAQKRVVVASAST
jgi:hypothetical protein